MFSQNGPVSILADWKSLFIAFLNISDQYATFLFFEFYLQNGHWRPFWMTENHFRSHFSPFQINTQLLFFFHKMAAGGHFGWPKITFDLITRHFRSTFIFFIFFYKMWRPFWLTKNHFNRISRYFRSIHNLNFYYFFSENGLCRPFWMTENHFRSHFSLFQNKTNLFFLNFFFTKWPLAGILDDGKSFLIAFLGISDQYATFIFWIFLKMATSGHFGYPIFAKIERDLPIL